MNQYNNENNRELESNNFSNKKRDEKFMRKENAGVESPGKALDRRESLKDLDQLHLLKKISGNVAQYLLESGDLVIEPLVITKAVF